MTKLEWCKANAPEALKSESDETILETMESTYRKMCQGDGTSKYVARNLTLRDMCDRFPRMWLYLDNMRNKSDGSFYKADVVAAYATDDQLTGVLNHKGKGDHQMKIMTAEEVLNVD